jgi:hypothetical protein
MPHRQAAAALQVGDAADVGADSSWLYMQAVGQKDLVSNPTE